MSDDEVLVYPYGFQCRATFRQSPKSSDIIGVAYSPLAGDFALLDGSGITHWNKDTQIDKRILTYPSNRKQLLKQIIFIPKYGLYFALAKDNTVQLLNSLLQCTHIFHADDCTILCMLYDITRDVLITAGVGGLKMWRYLHHKSDRDKAGGDNYFVLLREVLTKSSQWITRIELCNKHDRLLCIAQKEVLILDSVGEHIYTLCTTPSLPLTDCCYCPKFKLYVTASVDTAMRIWSEQGTLLHTLNAHSKAVTSVLMHPQSDVIMLSASLDKSIRMWNLETWEEIYKVHMCDCGIQWVGLTRDNQLFCGTSRELTVWSITFVADFFSQTRVSISRIHQIHGENKSPRMLAVGEDSSVRLLNAKTGQSLSTVLPPPQLSPLQKILDVGYSRYYGLLFILIENFTIWVYTTRTDPSSRVDVWEQDVLKLMLHSTDDVNGALGVAGTIQCITVLQSHITVNGEEGPVTPTCVNLLLLALQDGRIVFVDPVVKGLKYHAVAVHRDPICNVTEVHEKGWLVITSLSHGTTVSLLSLPHLKPLAKIYLGPGNTVFTFLDNALVCSVQQAMLRSFNLGVTASGCFDTQVIAERQQDNNNRINTIDSCPTLDIIATSGCDGILRIWDSSLTPTRSATPTNRRFVFSHSSSTREIILNTTLSTACFLNHNGDILVGFLNNIYKVPGKYTTGNFQRKQSVNSYMTDSTIFEDPAIVFENMGDPPLTNINNYLMPYEGKFNTDWQGLCITDIDEPIEEVKEKTESEQADSIAPTDLVTSPCSTPLFRSVINLSVSSLSEGVYCEHYDLDNNFGEVWDAWQMPKCGHSPRPSPSPSPSDVETPSPPIVQPPVLVPGPTVPTKPRRKSYQLPVTRSCYKREHSREAPKLPLSDLSQSSGEEDEGIGEKKRSSKSVPLWKPNGPNKNLSQSELKSLKKKKLEKRRSKKRIMLNRLDSKASDRFSDLTRTDDSEVSIISGDLNIPGIIQLESEETRDTRLAEERKMLGWDVEGKDKNITMIDGSHSPTDGLATLVEGATEGISLGPIHGDKKKSKKKKKKKSAKGTNAMLPNNALNAMLSPDHKGRLHGVHGEDGLSIAPSPPNIKTKSEGLDSDAVTDSKSDLIKVTTKDKKKRVTTATAVTDRLAQSKSVIVKGTYEKDKLISETIKRVQSAPEARHITPPTLHRTKQSCPLKFSDILKAEEVCTESKWILQCMETELFSQRVVRKRVASAPPRFNHPPGSLRPAYMDKAPNPPVEPQFDEDWHDKILERHEQKKKVVEQRHHNAAVRRVLIDKQKEQRDLRIQDKKERKEKVRSVNQQLQPTSTPQNTVHSQASRPFRVKSAVGFSSTSYRPSPSFTTALSGVSSLESQSHDNFTTLDDNSPLLAKTQVLRNASEQFLCSSG